jgi:hypothetical protein
MASPLLGSQNSRKMSTCLESTLKQNAAEPTNLYLFVFHEQVPGEGLEPTRIAPPDPKSGASANSAIRARLCLASLPRLCAA